MFNILCYVVFFCFSSALFSLERLEYLPAQDNIQVEYFFSFQCKGCTKISELLDQSSITTDTITFQRHPLVKNSQGLLLVKAQLIGEELGLPKSFYQDLYSMGQKNFSKKEVIALLESYEPNKASLLWKSYRDDKVSSKIKESLERAKILKLSELPSFYISGPDGVFLVAQKDQHRLEELPQIVEEVVALQLMSKENV